MAGRRVAAAGGAGGVEAASRVAATRRAGAFSAVAGCAPSMASQCGCTDASIGDLGRGGACGEGGCKVCGWGLPGVGVGRLHPSIPSSSPRTPHGAAAWQPLQAHPRCVHHALGPRQQALSVWHIEQLRKAGTAVAVHLGQVAHRQGGALAVEGTLQAAICCVGGSLSLHVPQLDFHRQTGR